MWGVPGWRREEATAEADFAAALDKAAEEGFWAARSKNFVVLAFAQRLQYDVVCGALMYLGSRTFRSSSMSRNRDFTLAPHHVDETVVAVFQATSYLLPFVFAATRASSRVGATHRSGLRCVVGGAVSAIALLPVMVSAELFLAATFFGTSSSIAMLVFAYVAAAETSDATDATGRAQTWCGLYYALNLGACAGVLLTTYASSKTHQSSTEPTWAFSALLGGSTALLQVALWSCDALSPPPPGDDDPNQNITALLEEAPLQRRRSLLLDSFFVKVDAGVERATPEGRRRLKTTSLSSSSSSGDDDAFAECDADDVETARDDTKTSKKARTPHPVSSSSSFPPRSNSNAEPSLTPVGSPSRRYATSARPPDSNSTARSSSLFLAVNNDTTPLVVEDERKCDATLSSTSSSSLAVAALAARHHSALRTPERRHLLLLDEMVSTTPLTRPSVAVDEAPPRPSRASTDQRLWSRRRRPEEDDGAAWGGGGGATTAVVVAPFARVVAVLVDGARRRLLTASALAVAVASIAGFALNAVAWALIAVAEEPGDTSCKAWRGLFAVEEWQLLMDRPLVEAAWAVACASFGLLVGSAVVAQRCDRDAGYLEGSKKMHGGRFEDGDVDHAKDTLLVMPFVGLCMLYQSLYYFGQETFANQMRYLVNRDLGADSDSAAQDAPPPPPSPSGTMPEAKESRWCDGRTPRLAEAVWANLDSFAVLLVLPVLHGLVFPAVEARRGSPARPLQKMFAAGCAMAASFASALGVELLKEKGHFFFQGDPQASQLGNYRDLPDLVQAPQYFFMAVSTSCFMPAVYEVFYSEVPPDLRTMALAMYMYTLAVGHTLGASFKFVVAPKTLVPTFSACLAALGAALVTWSACPAAGPAGYIYRQDRQWTLQKIHAKTRRPSDDRDDGGAAVVVVEGARRGNPAVDEEEAAAAALSQPFLASASAPVERHLRRREIVAVLRTMFDDLDAQFLIPFSLLTMGRLVASGGSGQVYRGRYAGARVAIKSLYSQMMDPDYVEEVRHEARMLAAVRHPHITNFHGISRFENRLLLVTEFVSLSLDGLVAASRRRAFLVPRRAGASVGQEDDDDHDDDDNNNNNNNKNNQKRPDRFSVEDARRLWVELAQTLVYLHAAGLAHRDIKPSNMLLLQGRDGRYHLKLCDLGMARFSSSRRNHFVTLGVGTPAYSPPESYRPASQAGFGTTALAVGSDDPPPREAEIADLTKWDIFSFATVVWYSWHCRDPFPGLSVPEVVVAVTRGDRPEFCSTGENDLRAPPPQLRALVARMWHQSPDRRPTAADVLAALQDEALTKDLLHLAYKESSNLAGDDNALY